MKFRKIVGVLTILGLLSLAGILFEYASAGLVFIINPISLGIIVVLGILLGIGLYKLLKWSFRN